MARGTKQDTTSTESLSEAQQRAALRSKAERIVLDRHRDEFYKEAEVLFKQNGLTFHRRLTPQEKAEQKMRELLAEFPDLAQTITDETTESEEI